MKKKSLFTTRIKIILAIIGLCIFITGLAFFFMAKDTSTIPSSISSKLTFSPFVIDKKSSPYKAESFGLIRDEKNQQILTYTIIQNDMRVMVSQYPQPSEFTEIPEYKERFLTNVAKQYETVQTSNGALYLGRLTRGENKQIGIFIERGLVVFMSPDTDLSTVTWRSIGDQMEIKKILN